MKLDVPLSRGVMTGSVPALADGLGPVSADLTQPLRSRLGTAVEVALSQLYRGMATGAKLMAVGWKYSLTEMRKLPTDHSERTVQSHLWVTTRIQQLSRRRR